MIFETDLLVIGAGPGGYVASLYAAKKGLKVTLIEKRFIGGTCLNIGCIATKAFAKSASLFHEMKHSVQFGIHSTDLISAVDALLGNPHPLHYDQIPSVIFTHPVIATIGLTESCLKAQEIPYHLAKVPGTANGKALIDDEAMGVVKLFEDPLTKHLIGAQVLGMDAENLIGILGLAIQNKLTAEDLKKTIFAHPTTSELIHEAGLGLLGEAIHYAD